MNDQIPEAPTVGILELPLKQRSLICGVLRDGSTQDIADCCEDYCTKHRRIPRSDVRIRSCSDDCVPCLTLGEPRQAKKAAAEPINMSKKHPI
jgi:hypothetical protein